MGDCIWCHSKAGWFSTEHKECAAKRSRAINAFTQRALATATGQLPIDALRTDIPALGGNYVQGSEVRPLLVRGFEGAVDSLLDDHVISEEEEAWLGDYAQGFDLSDADLNVRGARTRVVMGSVLRRIMAGELPRLQIEQDGLPFNLQKSEDLVWVFRGVGYYEERSRTEYRGGSPAMSVRVMKGVYIREKAFRGHPVVTTELTHIDNGPMALTTKHLYFAGQRKSHRIPYAKIVTFQPYSDGLGVQRDAASAKPQVYKLEHGWFAYNLARNLAER